MQKYLADNWIKENVVEPGSLVEDKDHGIGLKYGIGWAKGTRRTHSCNF